MSRTSLYVALVLAAALDSGSLSAQKNVPALDAEIETTFTTPQGRFSSPGHYYRSQDGTIREDSPLGSMIIDVRRGTVTLLNRATKEAKVIAMASQARRAAADAANGLDPFEEGIVDGHAVSKARRTTAGSTAEVWTAKDLAVAVLSKIEAPNFAMTKVLRNVSLREPDPDVFRIPKAYKVTHEAGLPTAPPLPPGTPLGSPSGAAVAPPRH
jgi:hypothetical protein